MIVAVWCVVKRVEYFNACELVNEWNKDTRSCLCERAEEHAKNESVDGEGADGVDGCCCRGGETALL